MECALVCPDAAIPNTVHDIRDLMLAAIGQIDIAETQREALRGQVPALADAVREIYRGDKDAKPFHEVVGGGGRRARHRERHRQAQSRQAGGRRSPAIRSPRRGRSSTPWRRPSRARGGLYSVAIDPWKCSGCLECLDVCGPHALVERQQDAALLDTLQERFEFLSRLPNTPSRFFEGATKPDGDTKRLMLDRNNYYATTGGHGACRGCGEVTAIRLVTGANHAIHDRQRKEHIREVESLIDKPAGQARSR